MQWKKSENHFYKCDAQYDLQAEVHVQLYMTLVNTSTRVARQCGGEGAKNYVHKMISVMVS